MYFDNNFGIFATNCLIIYGKLKIELNTSTNTEIDTMVLSMATGKYTYIHQIYEGIFKFSLC